MFCQNCGAELPDGSKFCNSCGTEQGVSNTAPPTAQFMPQKVEQAPHSNFASTAQNHKTASRKDKILRGCLIAVLAFIGFCILIVVIGSLLPNTAPSSTTSASPTATIASRADAAPTVAKTPTSDDILSPEDIISALNTVEIPVIKAGITEQHSQYKSLYPDILYAVVKNNSDDTIKNMVIAFLGFDKNGYPKKIPGQLGNYDASYERRGTDNDANLTVGATSSKSSGLGLTEIHEIEYVLACVIEAELYNGEVWENPYYDIWNATFENRPLPDFLK